MLQTNAFKSSHCSTQSIYTSTSAIEADPRWTEVWHEWQLPIYLVKSDNFNPQWNSVPRQSETEVPILFAIWPCLRIYPGELGPQNLQMLQSVLRLNQVHEYSCKGLSQEWGAPQAGETNKAGGEASTWSYVRNSKWLEWMDEEDVDTENLAAPPQMQRTAGTPVIRVQERQLPWEAWVPNSMLESLVITQLMIFVA